VFTTAADVKGAVAAALNLSVDSLPSSWDAVIADARTAAYNDILGTFLAMGYTQAQVDAWDFGKPMEKDQALYWALVRAPSLHNLSVDYVSQLDRRKQMAASVLVTGGKDVDPGGLPDSPEGEVTSGAFDTSDMTFGPDVQW
jgi:hypothetical protein